MPTTSHKRVKDIDYDDDEVYSDEDYDEGDNSLTAEDQAQIDALTPVVRANLEEASLQASDKEIADALWDAYWDIAETVACLKSKQQPKVQKKAGSITPPKVAAPKAKSKFDLAQEASTKAAGGKSNHISFILCIAIEEDYHQSGLLVTSEAGKRPG
jgi:elongation factor 1 alpha-like protein